MSEMLIDTVGVKRIIAELKLTRTEMEQRFIQLTYVLDDLNENWYGEANEHFINNVSKRLFEFKEDLLAFKMLVENLEIANEQYIEMDSENSSQIEGI